MSRPEPLPRRGFKTNNPHTRVVSGMSWLRDYGNLIGGLIAAGLALLMVLYTSYTFINPHMYHTPVTVIYGGVTHRVYMNVNETGLYLIIYTPLGIAYNGPPTQGLAVYYCLQVGNVSNGYLWHEVFMTSPSVPQGFVLLLNATVNGTHVVYDLPTNMPCWFKVLNGTVSSAVLVMTGANGTIARFGSLSMTITFYYLNGTRAPITIVPVRGTGGVDVLIVRVANDTATIMAPQFTT